MRVRVTAEALDPWAEITAFQSDSVHLRGQFGATACFVGTMRDFNEGDAVTRLSLEHYPGMTERQLEKITVAAADRFEILDVLVVHRVGDLLANDPIVVVVVWSVHRKAAFDACRSVMEELKTNAPFWKKEYLQQGARWVDKNTAG